MANLFSVKDKVVVITGGTGVLGKAIAAHLAEEGAKVILLGRKTEVGNKIVESIRTQGGEALFLTTDVLDRKILEQNLADILKAYGRIDALLNAAGGNMPGATISPTGDIFDLKLDEFQKVLDLNLTGGGAKSGRYRQFLIHGCFPPFDACGRLCRCQGRNHQFHRIYGHGDCQKVW